MDHSADLGADSPANQAAESAAAGSSDNLIELVRLPEHADPESLSDIARRDLYTALQLLAQRAQYFTGASGVAIALREGGQMICRASAGSAPETGIELPVDSGLSGESVRSRQPLRCDDAGTDPRVNRETCLRLGIQSAVVIPLIRENEVIGVFELFASRPHAFEDRDMTGLAHLTEMLQTTIEQNAAIDAVEKEIAKKEPEPVKEPAPAESDPAHSPRLLWSRPEPDASHASPSPQPGSDQKPEINPQPLSAHIGTCKSCGFPVSEGRILCVDCEVAQANSGTVPPFLAEMAKAEPAWKSAHTYVMGLLLFLLLVFAVLASMR